MTDQTIAIAAIAAGGAVVASLITAIVTYKVTNRQVTSAAEEGTTTRTHEVDLNRQDRNQARIYDAYVAVMRHVGHWSRFADFVRQEQVSRTDPPRPLPKPDEIDFTSEAQSALCASAAVQAAVIEFNKRIMRLQVALGSLRTVEGFASEFEPASKAVVGEAMAGVGECAAELVEAGAALRKLMADELAA